MAATFNMLFDAAMLDYIECCGLEKDMGNKESAVVKLVNDMLAGDVLALARLITKVERGDADVPRIMRLICPHIGRAYCIGITGPPGAGKSTVVDRLTAVIRKKMGYCETRTYDKKSKKFDKPKHKEFK